MIARPLVTQLARDVIAMWLHRSTALPIVQGDGNEPRPALPFVGFTFPRGRPGTGYQQALELTETIGATTITITAAQGARAAALLGTALVELTRGATEAASVFAARWATEAAWWLRGRATAAAAGSVVTVTPLSPGLLVAAEAVEGLTLASADGAPTCRVQRVYQATCRVEVCGVAGAPTGAVGDGFDTYSIEAAIREGLTDQTTKRLLRGGWLVPLASPAEVPVYASLVSGARRESRVTLDVAFGWSGLFVRAPSGISDVAFSLELGASLSEELDL